MTEPFSLQVVIDATEPHVLADWWADTLNWDVEPQDSSFIRSMIEQGYATEADTVLHRGQLVWASATAIRPMASTGAGQPRILFQQVPEPKTTKNRIHLDVRQPDSVDLASFRDRLVERGAVEVGGGEQGPHKWTVFSDPEGNEFCVDQ